MADWDERAERWSRMQAQRSEAYGPATEMMLDLADIRTGNRVLDVAAGTGDQTLLAARRVGPSGYVLATDISTNMLNSAADAVRRAGLTNVETHVMDAENLDLDADSFDAVICRLGLHTFPDLPKAMRGMYRVAKPRGKVAAIVFSVVEKNPYEGVPFTVAHRWGSIMPPLFVLSDTGVLEKNFRDGGFPDVAVHTVSTQRRFPSSAEVIRRLKDDMPGQSIARLSDAEREQAWAEVEQQLRRFEGPNGCEVPGELLIGVGTK
jgi:ubiquinone/menaquinone biosynthesis C-methylase UbiE